MVKGLQRRIARSLREDFLGIYGRIELPIISTKSSGK